MRTLLKPFIVMFVMVTLQCAHSKSSSDPVANICSPLCNEEVSLEVECATFRGCYDIDINVNPDLYLFCWSPCWDVADQCFRLCAESFDDILQRCYTFCTLTPGDVTCIAACFDETYLKLKATVLTNKTEFPPTNFGEMITHTTTKTSPANFLTVQMAIKSESDNFLAVNSAEIDLIVENLEVKYRPEREEDTFLEVSQAELNLLLDMLIVKLSNDQHPTGMSKTLRSDTRHQVFLEYLDPYVKEYWALPAPPSPKLDSQLSSNPVFSKTAQQKSQPFSTSSPATEQGTQPTSTPVLATVNIDSYIKNRIRKLNMRQNENAQKQINTLDITSSSSLNITTDREVATMNSPRTVTTQSPQNGLHGHEEFEKNRKEDSQVVNTGYQDMESSEKEGGQFKAKRDIILNKLFKG